MLNFLLEDPSKLSLYQMFYEALAMDLELVMGGSGLGANLIKLFWNPVVASLGDIRYVDGAGCLTTSVGMGSMSGL